MDRVTTEPIHANTMFRDNTHEKGSQKSRQTWYMEQSQNTFYEGKMCTSWLPKTGHVRCPQDAVTGRSSPQDEVQPEIRAS